MANGKTATNGKENMVASGLTLTRYSITTNQLISPSLMTYHSALLSLTLILPLHMKKSTQRSTNSKTAKVRVSMAFHRKLTRPWTWKCGAESTKLFLHSLMVRCWSVPRWQHGFGPFPFPDVCSCWNTWSWMEKNATLEFLPLLMPPMMILPLVKLEDTPPQMYKSRYLTAYEILQLL